MSGLTATWLVLGLVLILFGARAWVVETSRGRLTTAGNAQRGLTAAVAASVVLLIGMATVNGGLELISLLANGEAQTAAPVDGAPVVGGTTDPAGQQLLPPGVADPNAVPGGVVPDGSVPGAVDPNAVPAPAPDGGVPAPANP